MARYHLSPNDGKPRKCSARIKCDYADANDGSGIAHYPNKAAAMEAYAKNMKKQHNTFTEIKKPTTLPKQDNHNNVMETILNSKDPLTSEECDSIGFSMDDINKKIASTTNDKVKQVLQVLHRSRKLLENGEELLKTAQKTYNEIDPKAESMAKRLSNTPRESNMYPSVERVTETLFRNRRETEKNIAEAEEHIHKASESFRKGIEHYRNLTIHQNVETKNNVDKTITEKSNTKTKKEKLEETITENTPLKLSEYETLGYDQESLVERRKQLAIGERTTESSNEANNLRVISSFMLYVKQSEKSVEAAEKQFNDSVTIQKKASKLLSETNVNDSQYAATKFLSDSMNAEVIMKKMDFEHRKQDLRHRKNRLHSLVWKHQKEYGGMPDTTEK